MCQQLQKKLQKKKIQVEKLCDVTLKAAKHKFNNFVTPETKQPFRKHDKDVNDQ